MDTPTGGYTSEESRPGAEGGTESPTTQTVIVEGWNRQSVQKQIDREIRNS